MIPNTMAELAFFLVFVFAMAWMIEAATAPAESADNVADAPTPILVPVILPLNGPGPAPRPPPPPPQTTLPPTPPIIPLPQNRNCLMELHDFDPPLTDTTRQAAAMAAQLSQTLPTQGLHGSFLEDEYPSWNSSRSAQDSAFDPEARAVIWIYLDWNQPNQVEITNNLRKNDHYVAYNRAGFDTAMDFLVAMGIANANSAYLNEAMFRRALANASQHVRVTLNIQSGTTCELKRVVRIRNVPGFSGDVKVDDFRNAATRLITNDSTRYTDINEHIQIIEQTMNWA